jgi:hypothetical protein
VLTGGRFASPSAWDFYRSPGTHPKIVKFFLDRDIDAREQPR